MLHFNFFSKKTAMINPNVSDEMMPYIIAALPDVANCSVMFNTLRALMLASHLSFQNQATWTILQLQNV